MAQQYKQKLNTRTGQFNLVPSSIIVFKASVANYVALPLVGNTIGDARITEDTDHWYSWDGSVWNDQGIFLALNWGNINGKPSSAVADIDDAVSKRHTQGTDQGLDTGGPNASTAAALKSVVNGTVNGIILGTTDPYGRRQIWNKLTNAIIRLGASGGDGDTDNIISEGLVSYGKNLQNDPMAILNFSYVRLKSNRIGIYNSKSGGYVGYIVKMDTTEDEWYITDNNGVKKFRLFRSTGQLVLSSISDGTNVVVIADIKDAVSKRHSQNTDLYLDNIVKNVLYVDGNRSDIYTANGSITKPFKKIQDAIDAVTAPSATNKYLIEIAPGAYYSDALAINKVYVTFRSCGLQGARISGAITVTNPSDPTPEQITFVGLRISGGLTCLASHIAINCVDCNVTGSAWVINPTVPTDDEYLQVWGGLYNVSTTLTNVYTYLMGGGYYCTFVATNCEFNINNADINDPFQVTLNGTVIASAYGDRAGNSKFIVNAGATLNIDADTEGGSVLTLDPAAILNRTTKASNVNNDSSVVGVTVKNALETLNSTKLTEDTEIKIKVYSQAAEPTLGADQRIAIWIDTDDSNKVYLIFRRTVGDNVLVELA